MYIPLTPEMEKILAASWERGRKRDEEVRVSGQSALNYTLVPLSIQVYKSLLDNSRPMDSDEYGVLTKLCDKIALETPSLPGMR